MWVWARLNHGLDPGRQIKSIKRISDGVSVVLTEKQAEPFSFPDKDPDQAFPCTRPCETKNVFERRPDSVEASHLWMLEYVAQYILCSNQVTF